MSRYVSLAALLFAPSIASAEAISQVAGLFNILVGLMLVAAFGFFFSGVGMWFARLGTYPTSRDEAIEYMQWGVVILFVLGVLLAVVQFVQQHVGIAYFIVGVVVVMLVIWMILVLSQTPKEKEDKH